MTNYETEYHRAKKPPATADWAGRNGGQLICWLCRKPIQYSRETKRYEHIPEPGQ